MRRASLLRVISYSNSIWSSRLQKVASIMTDLMFTPEILVTLYNDLKDRGKEGTHLVFNLSA